MTRPHDQMPPDAPSPDSRSDVDEALLLDFLGGELALEAASLFEKRLGTDGELARRRDRLEQWLEAERALYEPTGAASAVRIAAQIRAQVRAEENSQLAARKRATAGRRGTSEGVWARVLAFSVGLHVLVLGLIAFLDGGPTTERDGPTTYVDLSQSESFREYDAEADSAEFGRPYPRIAAWDSSLISDDFVLTEQEVLGDELPEQLVVPHEAQIAGLDHPPGVVGAMTRRLEPLLKHRRLDLLGFNAKGTLRAVERGLAYLSRRQREDGSFAAGSPGTGLGGTGSAGGQAGRSAMEETSLAMLAFLSDGHCSHARSTEASPDSDTSRESRGHVVGQGVHWLRQQLFHGAETDAQRSAHLAKRTVTELAPATVALCEDYMLSYGWLSPHAAQVRAREIGELVARLRQEQRVGAAAGVNRVLREQPWSVWALDAAARARIVEPNSNDQKIFAAWVETTADASQSSERKNDGALQALAVGTALLYAERGAAKPRFLDWSRAHAERLVEMLGAQGRARLGDPVGDTALILLALQVAYRTY